MIHYFLEINRIHNICLNIYVLICVINILFYFINMGFYTYVNSLINIYILLYSFVFNTRFNIYHLLIVIHV